MAAVLPPTQQPPKPDTQKHQQQQRRRRQQHEQPPSSPAQLHDAQDDDHASTHHLSAYLGISFSVFLSLLPKSALSLVPTLQSRNRYLLLRLHQAEEQLSQLKARRQEDSKANARVVEIFASHRNAWQQEERRLLQQIDDSGDEIARLQARVSELERNESELLSEVEELKREISERDEMLTFMSSKTAEFDDGGGASEVRASVEKDRERFREGDGDEDGGGGGGVGGLGYGQIDMFDSSFSSSASRFWAERPNNLSQDVKYESLETMHQLKHFVARRESPWKVEGELIGVSSKLKLLEQELVNMERISKNELVKVPSLMRKQAKRYQALAGKIDDLCKRMQASDPCESALSSELRTQRQTEFLLEAFRLQQRAAETGQKLLVLQTEINSGYLYYDEQEAQTKLTTRRSLDSIKNNFKEIQRNLEIWLARITGDLKGILARDGASRVREYYVSRYSYV
ncbi:hypothetical protein Dimus_030153 [Dionaea muscipula]